MFNLLRHAFMGQLVVQLGVRRNDEPGNECHWHFVAGLTATAEQSRLCAKVHAAQMLANDQPGTHHPGQTTEADQQDQQIRAGKP